MKKTTLLAIAVIILSSGISSAQIDLTQKAPVDPEIRIGKLENGLTYFIRHNKEPEKRASYYIIQNVGAILEEDDQQGLAHFLEHMAFNGTKHFPPMGIIGFLEKHGVAFGRNINAGTGFDETVYNLSDVPVDAPGLIDSCLLVLHDWSHYLSLTDEEIDKERGVIEEEWRTRRDANTRMIYDVIIPVIFKGSKYAERNLIGTPEILRNFKSDVLRNYYKKWYRPDLQAIAIVGDINVDEIEGKIKSLFSNIPKPVDPAPRPEFGMVPHDETYFAVATDKEAPQTSINIVIDHKAPVPEMKNMGYLRDNHLVSLMNSMINTRIEELLQKPDPPFISGSVYYGSFLARGYDAFMIGADARKNEEAQALKAVYTEAERARRHGFTEGELKRAKSDLLTSMESRFKQKDKIDNDTYASGISQYFTKGEPLTSIDFDYDFLKKVIDGIKLDEINNRFRQLMTDRNRSVFIMGQEAEGVKHLTKEEAMNIISEVEKSEVTAYQDNTVGESLISQELKGSKVIKTVELPQFNAVEWTLENNARVVYRRAAYEKDNVLLSAFSFGGISRLDESGLMLPANLVPTLIQMYGVGDYDNVTLQKMLAGKKASVTLGLSEVSETMSGSSTPKDFETMMQLLYLRMAAPRFDSLAHSSFIARISAMIGNMEKDPNKIKNDSISLITTGYHPRTPVLNRETISSVTIEQIRRIYTDRFNGADEFIFFIVGNIGQDTVMRMAEKYIGSIPSSGRKENWTDRGVEQPEGKVVKEIEMPLTVPKATVFLSFANDLKYKPENSLGLEVINGILDIKYVETVREDEGGTYGVRVGLSAQKRPEEKGEAMVMFDCDPARANDLRAIIYREITSMVKEGPSQENLDKAVNNILKNREESKLHNTYWLSTLSRYYSYGINWDDPENYENILKSFTVKDIKKLSGKMFGKADVVDLIFKPAK